MFFQYTRVSYLNFLGCKKFSMLNDFQEKPEASKCGRCRYRGRKNYLSKKTSEKENGLLHANNSSYDSDTLSTPSYPHTPDAINVNKTTHRPVFMPRSDSADFGGDMMLPLHPGHRRQPRVHEEGKPPIHRMAIPSTGVPPIPYHFANMVDVSTPATKKARLEFYDGHGIAATFNGVTYGINAVRINHVSCAVHLIMLFLYKTKVFARYAILLSGSTEK